MRGRSSTAAALLLVTLGITGCSGGGSDGGGGSSGAPITQPPPPPPPPPVQAMPPALAVLSPARGATLDARSNPNGMLVVSGTAIGIGSPVVAVLVNGTPATLTANGAWTLTVPLAKGGNELLVTAANKVGEVTRSVRSVVYADRYEPPAVPIASALGARVSENAFNSVAPILAQLLQQSGIIDQMLLNGGNPIYSDSNHLPSWLGGGCYIGINITIQSVSYGAPTLHFDCTPQGTIVATMVVPNFDLAGVASDGCGIPWPSVTGEIKATEVDVTLALTPSVDPRTGQVTIAGGGASVVMQGYDFSFTNLPGQVLNVFTLGQLGGAVQAPLQDAVAKALDQDLPPRLSAQLNGLFTPVSRTFAGRTVTFGMTPQTVAVDDDGMTFSCSANVTGPLAPSMPAVAGSYFDAAQGLALPAYPALSPDFSVSLLSNAWNRTLFTSWQSGFWNMRVDQSLLTQLGLTGSGSVRFDTNFLGRFIGGISKVIPPGVNAPVAIDTEPLCQPIVLFVPTGPFRGIVQLPELHMHLLADPGHGYVELFEFAVHAELDVDFTIQNGRQLALVIGPTPRFDAEVIHTALPPDGIDWGLVVSIVVPPAISAVAATIQPIPLPAMGLPSAPLGLKNPTVAVEGPRDEYLTAHGDL